MMKAVMLACIILGLTSSAYCEESPSDSGLMKEQGRFLYFNSTSSASTLTLLGALILLMVIAYLIFSDGFSTPFNRNDYQNGQYQYGQYDQYEGAYPQYRSNDQAFNFNNVNVLKWIETLQDIYENFDYNDLECHKRAICEVMKEPQNYGPMAKSLKQGFQLARFIPQGLPEEMRELIDEYLDANDSSEQQKECKEFFPCAFSISETFKRNLSGNDL